MTESPIAEVYVKSCISLATKGIGSSRAEKQVLGALVKKRPDI